MTNPTKVLQSVAWYGPYQVGGTEIYLEGLNAALARIGIVSEVILPRPGGAPENWRHQGLEVTTYPPREAVGEGASLDAFRALLRARGDVIYHQHSWTPDCGGDHLTAAKALGLRTALTVHVPSNTCLRGSMMRFGEEACDGKVRETVCAACWAQGRGAPKPLAQMISLLPSMPLTLGGRIGTALSARRHAAQRASEVSSMIAHADRLVAVCQWLHDALALNGAPVGRLSLSRQGVGQSFLDQVEALPECVREPGPLRLLYLGRWHPVKGLDLVVRALRSLPDAAIELVIHGVGGGPEEIAYRKTILDLAAGDGRISVEAPIPREAIPAAMQDFDALVVPSTCLETGPLVVLEAQSAGLFVLGSNLGGIAELVDDPTKGRLVPTTTVAGWAKALAELAVNPPQGRRWPVRTMDACAGDMAELYAGLT